MTEPQEPNDYGEPSEGPAETGLGGRRRRGEKWTAADRSKSGRQPGRSPDLEAEGDAKRRLFRDPDSRPFAIMAAIRAKEAGAPELFWLFYNEARTMPDGYYIKAVRQLRRRGPGRWKGTIR